MKYSPYSIVNLTKHYQCYVVTCDDLLIFNLLTWVYSIYSSRMTSDFLEVLSFNRYFSNSSTLCVTSSGISPFVAT